MSSDDETELQREILRTWRSHPDATNREIADACDCSPSYVSQVKNRFDSYGEFDATTDRRDRELERTFGGDIFTDQPRRTSAKLSNPTEDADLAGVWDELPNNPVGHVMRAIVLIILPYVLYEVVAILVL